MNKLILSMALLFGLSSYAVAEDTGRYNQVRFTVNAADDVENDLISINLYYQAQGIDLVSISAELNNVLDWAVKLSDEFPAINKKTFGYQSHLLYENGKLSKRWQVKQSIRLSGHEKEKIQALAKKLQEKMAIGAISYDISKEKRTFHEKELMGQVIKRFRSKSDDIVRSMGMSDYKVVALSFGQPGSHMAYMERAAAPMMLSSVQLDAGPVIEVGTQRIKVSVTAEIELIE